jgi:hypothetical protein
MAEDYLLEKREIRMGIKKGEEGCYTLPAFSQDD